MKKARYCARSALLIALLLAVALALSACERPDPEVTVVALTATPGNPPTPVLTPFGGGFAPPTPVPNQAGLGRPLPTYVGTPTPDPPHATITASNDPYLVHYVSAGETLSFIAGLYGRPLEELLTLNEMSESDILYVGQEVRVPQQSALLSPSFKIIPDSELVYGPAAKGFNVRDFASLFNGYLLAYGEEVEGQYLAGPEIVQLVAHRFSVNPRLLLAVLEHRAGWVTQSINTDSAFPLGYTEASKPGLYTQLSWAANELNWGYYGRAEGNLNTFSVSDGAHLAFAADINHGTAGVQRLMAGHTGASYESWLQDVGPDGFFATYSHLFGNPFAYTVDPLWPVAPEQPPLQLPWASGETWYFTGGPHGGWASGAAWAALDFVPDGEQFGCVQTDAWVRAMADGLVTRSDFGAVVVDLDGDSYGGTGWAITYMHLETRDRIAAGTLVQTGDPLGHPSCEGGFSNGTHVHIARTYNGRWVSADGPVPFVMGGWVSQGLGREYDGLLVRGNVVKEACECREEINAIKTE
ncbi:MAG TPA: LysM peptidoglycan-binding domain-containing protein [Anaerolineae bacterium]